MEKWVLFDLDGTLLPMDQEVFTKAYFKGLAGKLMPYGYDADTLVKTIWSGTAAMIKNDGSRTNEEAFWEVFYSVFGEGAREHFPLFEEFYKKDFDKVKVSCGFNENAKKTVDALKKKGYKIGLATNPIFPAIATEARTRWAGFSPEDFEFYTTYENSHFCKPNPSYYKEIVEKHGINAGECFMVGNDAIEDVAAQKLGIKVFLLTDCLINKNGADLSGIPHGSFKELSDFFALSDVI